MKKAILTFDSQGVSGNIFQILLSVKGQLQFERRLADYNECKERVCNSENYAAALSVIREYVDLVDVRGLK